MFAGNGCFGIGAVAVVRWIVFAVHARGAKCNACVFELGFGWGFERMWWVMKLGACWVEVKAVACCVGLLVLLPFVCAAFLLGLAVGGYTLMRDRPRKPYPPRLGVRKGGTPPFPMVNSLQQS